MGEAAYWKDLYLRKVFVAWRLHVNQGKQRQYEVAKIKSDLQAELKKCAIVPHLSLSLSSISHLSRSLSHLALSLISVCLLSSPLMSSPFLAYLILFPSAPLRLPLLHHFSHLAFSARPFL